MPTYECLCGAKYRFSRAHLGRKSKCKKCGAVFTLAEPDAPIPVADESPLEVMIDSETARQAGVAATFIPPPSVAAAQQVVIDDDRPIRGPGGYWKDLTWAFLFASQPRDLVIFMIILVVVSGFEGFLGLQGVFFVRGGMGYGGVLYLVLWVFYNGWYASVRFAILESAAAGDDSLPDLNMSGYWLDDYVVPAFQWLGSWAVVMLPALGYVIYYAISLGSKQLRWSPSMIFGSVPYLNAADALSHPAFIGLVGFGFFMWPMIVLCIALGGFTTLYRVDLMARSILKTLPVYTFTVVIVFGVEAGGAFLQDAIYSTLAPMTLAGGLAPFGDRLIAATSSNAICVYAAIVMVRAIGLYFHHFRHRFAWNW